MQVLCMQLSYIHIKQARGVAPVAGHKIYLLGGGWNRPKFRLTKLT
jgi:hypothetical protein